MMLDKRSEQAQSAEKQTLIQLIIFLAGDEEFGVPIEVVREIIKVTPITPIPTAPDFVKGIINVRGEIVTTIDVKSRFLLPDNENNSPKHIIVTKQEDGLFGLVVDEVVEVLRINSEDIKPAPALVARIHKKYVSGVVTHDNRLIILLDLMEVLSQKDLLQFSRNNQKREEWDQKTGDSAMMKVKKTSKKSKRPKEQ